MGGLFSDFQYGFRSSQSTPDFLTLLIARAFNRSRATRVVAFDIFKAFDKVWKAGLLQNLSRMEFHVRYLVYFFFFQ